MIIAWQKKLFLWLRVKLSSQSKKTHVHYWYLIESIDQKRSTKSYLRISVQSKLALINNQFDYIAQESLNKYTSYTFNVLD